MNNIPNYEECVKYALDMKGIAGDTFKDTNLRVYERDKANPNTVFTALRKITDLVSLYVPKSNDIQTFPIATFVEAWEATGGICATAFPPNEKTYRPKLLDLKHVELPSGFEELREAIAENVHDTWALERQSEGWTYGPKRDDSKLETPDMVPYAQLPESEKGYDRIMAEDTLRLVTALGYKIEKHS
jgi:hypothetical protein